MSINNLSNIKNNKELSDAIDKLINESGLKRIYISEKIGIQNQNLRRKINSNLSLDDANRILDILGYNAKIIIKKD